jgi:hypothetical protein
MCTISNSSVIFKCILEVVFCVYVQETEESRGRENQAISVGGGNSYVVLLKKSLVKEEM